MKLALVRADDVLPRLWKNGGGTARDLLLWPSASDPQLTVSVAGIEHDGPFSAYPDIERWFAVIDGAGVELLWPQAVRRLHAGRSVLHFDGAHAPDCRLVRGPSRALNVLLKRGSARIGVRAATPLSTPPTGFAHFALFCREPARLQPPTGRPVELPAWSLAWGERQHAVLELLAPDASAWWIGFGALEPGR